MNQFKRDRTVRTRKRRSARLFKAAYNFIRDSLASDMGLLVDYQFVYGIEDGKRMFDQRAREVDPKLTEFLLSWR